MDEFTAFIHKKVKEVKETEKTAVFKKERAPVGVCPWCESDLYRYEETDPSKKKYIRYYCSNKGVCSFSMQTDNQTITTATGKKLTEKQLQKLCAYGFIALTCKSKYENGNDYKAKFEIVRKEVGDKVYANLSFSPVKSKQKKTQKKLF